MSLNIVIDLAVQTSVDEDLAASERLRISSWSISISWPEEKPMVQRSGQTSVIQAKFSEDIFVPRTEDDQHASLAHAAVQDLPNFVSQSINWTRRRLLHVSSPLVVLSLLQIRTSLDVNLWQICHLKASFVCTTEMLEPFHLSALEDDSRCQVLYWWWTLLEWDWCFCGCESLRSFACPRIVESIHESCFKNCTSLSEFDFHEGSCLRISEPGHFLDACHFVLLSVLWQLNRSTTPVSRTANSCHYFRFEEGSCLKVLDTDSDARTFCSFAVPQSVRTAIECFYDCASLDEVLFENNSSGTELEGSALRGSISICLFEAHPCVSAGKATRFPRSSKLQRPRSGGICSLKDGTSRVTSSRRQWQSGKSSKLQGHLRCR